MENDSRFIARIQENPVSRERQIWIYRNGMSGVELLKPDLVTLETVKYGEPTAEPTLKLYPEAFHALVDAMHGYKPSEGKYTEGKLEATEKHLEDMRKLVFKTEAV